jgi:hypothetical protein
VHVFGRHPSAGHHLTECTHTNCLISSPNNSPQDRQTHWTYLWRSTGADLFFLLPTAVHPSCKNPLLRNLWKSLSFPPKATTCHRIPVLGPQTKKNDFLRHTSQHSCVDFRYFLLTSASGFALNQFSS